MKIITTFRSIGLNWAGPIWGKQRLQPEASPLSSGPRIDRSWRMAAIQPTFKPWNWATVSIGFGIFLMFSHMISWKPGTRWICVEKWGISWHVVYLTKWMMRHLDANKPAKNFGQRWCVMLTCCFGRLIFGGKKLWVLHENHWVPRVSRIQSLDVLETSRFFETRLVLKVGVACKSWGNVCVCVCLPMISNWSNLEKMAWRSSFFYLYLFFFFVPPIVWQFFPPKRHRWKKPSVKKTVRQSFEVSKFEHPSHTQEEGLGVWEAVFGLAWGSMRCGVCVGEIDQS